jgi:quercetin dioxygenase-like cupin family protein
MSHWHRFLVGVLFTTVLSVAALSPAQDVAKVSETHKVLLENERVRVLDFHVKPGEKVRMHSHPAASIVYYLTDAKVKYTNPDGRTEERAVKAGTKFWIEAMRHDVENLGANEFHGLHIELKDSKRQPSKPSVFLSGCMIGATLCRFRRGGC